MKIIWPDTCVSHVPLSCSRYQFSWDFHLIHLSMSSMPYVPSVQLLVTRIPCLFQHHHDCHEFEWGFSFSGLRCLYALFLQTLCPHQEQGQHLLYCLCLFHVLNCMITREELYVFNENIRLQSINGQQNQLPFVWTTQSISYFLFFMFFLCLQFQTLFFFFLTCTYTFWSRIGVEILNLEGILFIFSSILLHLSLCISNWLTWNR